MGLGVNYSVISKSEMSTSPMNGQDMIMPMLTVTLPIYRKKYTAMQTETKFLKAASEQNYQATVNALQTEYYEALQLYNDAQRRTKLYDNQRYWDKQRVIDLFSVLDWLMQHRKKFKPPIVMPDAVCSELVSLIRKKNDCKGRGVYPRRLCVCRYGGFS